MRETLKTATITTDDAELDFATAKRLADAAAVRALDGPICLSWYDRAADRESPSHASECHGDCEIPGYVEYAVTRGAELRIVVDGGAFVFCYRPVGPRRGGDRGPGGPPQGRPRGANPGVLRSSLADLVGPLRDLFPADHDNEKPRGGKTGKKDDDGGSQSNGP